MIEILSTLLGKLVDIMLTKASHDKGREGFTALFTIYVYLSRLARDSNNLLYDLSSFLNGDQSSWKNLISGFNSLRDNLVELGRAFHRASPFIEIYDRDAAREIWSIMADKHRTLSIMWSWAYSSAKENRFPVLLDDPSGKRPTLRLLPKDPPKIKWRFFRRAPRKTTQLTDQDIEILRREYEKGLRALKEIDYALNRYADFIRANFKLEDIVMNVSLDGKTRI